MRYIAHKYTFVLHELLTGVEQDFSLMLLEGHIHCMGILNLHVLLLVSTKRTFISKFLVTLITRILLSSMNCEYVCPLRKTVSYIPGKHNSDLHEQLSGV